MTLLEWLVIDGRRRAAAEANGEQWPPAGAQSPFPIAATLDSKAGWNEGAARVIGDTGRWRQRRAPVIVEKGEQIW